MSDKRSGESEVEPKARSQDDPEPSSTPEPSGLAAGSQQQSTPETADMQAFIGRQLRAVYDDVAKQPIPDRFIELMKQLDQNSVDP